MIHLTGDIATKARTESARLPLGGGWAEILVLDEALSGCTSGCKLYARRGPEGVEYALFHMASYGCPLGRVSAASTVTVEDSPVATVDPMPVPVVRLDEPMPTVTCRHGRMLVGGWGGCAVQHSGDGAWPGDDGSCDDEAAKAVKVAVEDQARQLTAAGRAA